MHLAWNWTIHVFPIEISCTLSVGVKAWGGAGVGCPSDVVLTAYLEGPLSALHWAALGLESQIFTVAMPGLPLPLLLALFQSRLPLLCPHSAVPQDPAGQKKTAS